MWKKWMEHRSAEHKTICVTLKNRPRSTISNPKQGLTGLHNFVRYQSHTYNGSPLIFQKPSGIAELGITDTWIHRHTDTWKIPSNVYASPLGGGHNYNYITQKHCVCIKSLCCFNTTFLMCMIQMYRVHCVTCQIKKNWPCVEQELVQVIGWCCMCLFA